MEMMTITEGLAELKLIEKKIDKKKQFVVSNLSRLSSYKDPFEKEGGTKVFLTKEMQSISDLEKRFVAIKSAINQANISNTITIGEETKSIYEWITWKREVSSKQHTFFNNIQQAIKAQIDQYTARPTLYKDEEGKAIVADLLINLDYSEMFNKTQKIGDLIETVDGKLSLKNATVTIKI